MSGGKTGSVLLVGGAGGIGRAAAALFREGGWDVFLADKDSSRLEESVRSLGGGTGTVTPIELDLTDRTAVAALAAAFAAEGRRFRALVTLAGVHGTWPAAFLPDGEIERILTNNLSAHVMLVRDMLPVIEDGGRIVGVSSIAASVGVPMSSMYSASKAGLEAFYESLATEIAGRRVKVSIIRPGNVNTGFNETGNCFPGCGDESVDAAYKRVVERIDSRLGIPARKVAKAVYNAAASPRPRFLYVVGMNALKAHWAVRILGKGPAVRLMAWFFGFRAGPLSL